MAQDMRDTAEVLRAHRFELVGKDGLTRAVLGRLHEQDGQGVYGLDLLDGTGTRIKVVCDLDGPSVSLMQGGNERILLTVTEGRESPCPGPEILVCDPDGDPIIRVGVEDPIPST